MHHTYLNSVGRLTDFQASHSELLLEFELSIQTDSRKIYNCIFNAPFCISKHGLFYCTRNCYLTSGDKFLINFQLQQYEKLQVQHFTCLHEKTGFVSLLSNNMFLQNSTFFTQIGRDFDIPTDCIKLTKKQQWKMCTVFRQRPSLYSALPPQLSVRYGQYLIFGHIIANLQAFFCANIDSRITFPHTVFLFNFNYYCYT